MKIGNANIEQNVLIRPPPPSRPHANLLVHFEHGFQPLNLGLILAQQRVFRILVDFRRVFNVFGAIRVAQSGQRFVVVVVGRRDGGNHDGLGVAAWARGMSRESDGLDGWMDWWMDG